MSRVTSGIATSGDVKLCFSMTWIQQFKGGHLAKLRSGAAGRRLPRALRSRVSGNPEILLTAQAFVKPGFEVDFTKWDGQPSCSVGISIIRKGWLKTVGDCNCISASYCSTKYTCLRYLYQVPHSFLFIW